MKKSVFFAFAVTMAYFGTAVCLYAQDGNPNQAPTGTVRLVYPQWQGGNMGISYPAGAQILSLLAPASDAPLLQVPVERFTGSQLPLEDGIVGRTAIVRQLRAARSLLATHRPQRIVTFGGDCLVSQEPFSYLNELYGGKLGVLWIDAHPDVTTPKNYPNAHAMVLGNLLGEGDPGLAAEVSRHLNPTQVMFAGLNTMHDYEWEVVNRLGLRRAGSAELAHTSDPIMQWIRENNITHLAIHFDVDVLDPRTFRSQLFNIPGQPVNMQAGKMTLEQVSRIINDVSRQTDVVGLTIAEHMPWDDINLMEMMNELPIMK